MSFEILKGRFVNAAIGPETAGFLYIQIVRLLRTTCLDLGLDMRCVSQ